jgi:hypothetical protein
VNKEYLNGRYAQYLRKKPSSIDQNYSVDGLLDKRTTFSQQDIRLEFELRAELRATHLLSVSLAN